MNQNNPKTNTVLIVIILLVLVGGWILYKNQGVEPVDNNAAGGGVTVPALEGNSEDLVAFSLTSGQEVSGKMEVTGTVKNAYFFEANIGLNILDKDKKMLRQGHGDATTDWMTPGPVSFKGTLDFTGLPSGRAYVEIHNDNPSGLAENDKSILIPVIIR